MTKHCPVCAEPVKIPTGDKDAPIFIVFDQSFPQPKWGLPATSAFKSLFTKYSGIDAADCRYAYLYLHEPNNNQECVNFGLSLIKEELIQHEFFIACGADITRAMTGHSVMDTTGLIFLPKQTGLPIPIMPLISPAMLFVKNKGIGEYHFAMRRLKEYMNGRQ